MSAHTDRRRPLPADTQQGNCASRPARQRMEGMEGCIKWLPLCGPHGQKKASKVLNVLAVLPYMDDISARFRCSAREHRAWRTLQRMYNGAG